MKQFFTLFVLFFTVAALAQYPQRRPGPQSNDPWAYGPQNNTWNQSWNQRPSPRRGACFFSTANFQGNRFCVRSGDRLPALPGGFGDNISSIQVYGGARVTIFNDRNFANGRANVGRSVPDLRMLRFRDGHTWNNRVSSIVVN